MPGEVLALVGANGAGKTSTIEALEGYRRPSSGTVEVLGLDPRKDRAKLAAHVGVMLQQGGVYPSMSPAEALTLFAAYYPEPSDPGAILERLGLSTVADTAFKRLSGGEQRLLLLGLAIIGRPAVAFLDEPTAGVDPRARLEVRSIVRELADAGACVVLSSHDLDEVEAVADRVLMIDRGRAVAEGAPGQMSESPEEIRFVASPGLDKAALAQLMGGTVSESTPGRYRVTGEASPDRIARLTAWLAERGVLLLELRTGSESLPEVFARLTRPEPGADSEDRIVRALVAQTRAEILMTARRGESLLVTLGIPVIVLIFLGVVDIVPTDRPEPLDFLVPSVMALAIMSAAMVNLAIATGFERQYGVLKRLGTTPLGRPRLLLAKVVTILIVEVVQITVLTLIGLALGWRPSGDLGLTLAAIVVGTAAFGGIGLLMAGTLRAEATLAAANGLYVVLLLLGGIAVPVASLPAGLGAVASVLPSAALSNVLGSALGGRGETSGGG